MATITIEWDAETEGATIKHDGFKTNEMVIAVLDMVKDVVKFNQKVTRMQHLQMAHQQAMQEQAIRVNGLKLRQ